jgi:hypothetical protein
MTVGAVRAVRLSATPGGSQPRCVSGVTQVEADAHELHVPWKMLTEGPYAAAAGRQAPIGNARARD